MENVINFLKDTRIFYVATVENGKPKIRPFGAVMLFENKLYISTSNTKEVYKQIIKSPNISICACNDNRKWIRIEGIAKLDNRISAKQKMLDENPALLQNKRFSSAHDQTMAILYLDSPSINFY